MARPLEFGWFLPTAGDASTRLNDPNFAIPPDEELFKRVAHCFHKRMEVGINKSQ